MPHLPECLFLILLDTTELKFEHGGSHKRCTIKRKQVPLEPGFVMTVHKAQGQTMACMIMDLMGCVGMEPPYVMVSRAMLLDGLIVLRDFDVKQITKQQSEDMRREFACLTLLKWRMIVQYGTEGEVVEAKGELEGDVRRSSQRGTKQKSNDINHRAKKRRQMVD